MRAHRNLGLLTLLVLSACELDENEPSASNDVDAAQLDSGLDGSPDGSPDGGLPTSCSPGAVWRSTSQQLELRRFGYWEGSTGYSVDRASLSSAQLAALQSLCVIPTLGDQILDVPVVSLSITDADGSVAKYQAMPDNHAIAANPAVKQLDWSAVAAFSATFHCLSSDDSRARPLSGDAGVSARTPTLGTDPHCLHGVFARSGCTETRLKLAVGEAKTYTLSAGAWFGRNDCVQNLRIDLYDTSGATRLASSAGSDAGVAPRCTTLSSGLDAGTYLLQLTTQSPSGCDNTAGDYVLRVSSP